MAKVKRNKRGGKKFYENTNQTGSLQENLQKKIVICLCIQFSF